ncbi:MAG: DUF6933 domain-containing protein [Breznakibacter sp.]
MKRVYCSKKLGDYIGSIDQNLPHNFSEIKPSDWNAHLFILDRKKFVVFVHALTNYTVFIDKILKKDLQNINSIFEERLKSQLVNDNLEIKAGLFNILLLGQEIEFYRTNNNKQVIGRLNDFVRIFKFHCQYKYDILDKRNVIHENEIINSTPIQLTINNKKYWTTPIKEMSELIKTSA